MNVKKSLALWALSLGLLGASAAQAAVITFDDLPSVEFAGDIQNGYKGFNWDWFSYIDKFAMPNTGFEKGVVSGQYAAFNNFAATATTSGSTFDFNGAYLTAGWRDGLIVEATGFVNGLAQYTKSIVINSTQTQWFDFNFAGIDAISFAAYGGEKNPLLDFDGEFFILDNFTYNEPLPPTHVPEPSSITLFGLGLLLLRLVSARSTK